MTIVEIIASGPNVLEGSLPPATGVEVLIPGPQGPPGPGTGTPVALTDAATILVNAALGKLFRVTLGGNRTLDKPTNLVDGQMLMYEIKQDATGGRTLALHSAYHFGTDFTSITLSTAPNITDRLLVQYVQARDQLDVIGFKKGY